MANYIQIAHNNTDDRLIYRKFNKKPSDAYLDQLRANIELFFKLSLEDDFDVKSPLCKFLIENINKNANDYELILSHFSLEAKFVKINILQGDSIISSGWAV